MSIEFLLTVLYLLIAEPEEQRVARFIKFQFTKHLMKNMGGGT